MLNLFTWARLGRMLEFTEADQNWLDIEAAVNGLRQRLTANRTYYVRADGNDSNDGLTNTTGGAFLTIQKAIDTVAILDISIFSVTISVGAGTFGGFVCKDPVGAGSVSIVGAGMASTTISYTASSGAAIQGGTKFSISALKTTAPNGTARCVLAAAGQIITLSNVDFGACGAYHVDASGGTVNLGNYTVSGGAAIHWYAASGGRVIAAGITVTLTGTPAFSSSFAYADVMGLLRVNANTFTGSATGKRYTSNNGSVIYTNGAGANYLPGSIAGTVSGGIYA